MRKRNILSDVSVQIWYYHGVPCEIPFLKMYTLWICQVVMLQNKDAQTWREVPPFKEKPWGSRGQSPLVGGQGVEPPEAEAFLVLKLW